MPTTPSTPQHIDSYSIISISGYRILSSLGKWGIVEVALSDVEKLSDRITKGRQDTATAISRTKPRGAGRKEEINWKVIDPMLIEIYEEDSLCSQTIAHARLKPRLIKMGWGNTEEDQQSNTWIPGESATSKRITKLKNDNKINY